MEDILSRFIHIGDQIFEKLDSENLVKCRTVTNSWKIFIGNGKNLPICIMNAFTNIEKEKLWNTYKKCPTEKVARIAVDVEKVYKYSKNRPENAPFNYSRGRFLRKEKFQYLPYLPQDPMHVAIREEYFDFVFCYCIVRILINFFCHGTSLNILNIIILKKSLRFTEKKSPS